MKLIKWLFLVLLLALAGGGVWFYLNSGFLLRQAIEDYGSAALGSPVKVGGVVMEWAQGRGELKTLSVGQPSGFVKDGAAGRPLFEVDSVRLGVPLSADNGTDGVFRLTEIVVSGARLNVIATGRSTNVEAMQTQVERQVGTSSGTAEASDSAPVRLIIDRLVLTDMKTHVSSDVLGDLELSIPDIRESGLGKAEGGLTVEELGYAIIRPLSKSVTKALIRQGLDKDKLKAAVKARAKDKVDSELKKLSERLQSRD